MPSAPPESPTQLPQPPRQSITKKIETYYEKDKILHENNEDFLNTIISMGSITLGIAGILLLL